MDRVRLDGTLLEDESQFGVYLNGTWQLGARTSLFIRVENLTREFAEDRFDRLQLRSVGAEYAFGRRTSAILELTRTEENSDYASADLNYTADLVSLLFTRTFE
jgi:predicted porin